MEYHLTTKLDEETVRKLHIGDIVYLSGEIYTMRDQGHKRALSYLKEGKNLPIKLKNGVIYHCGPVVKKLNSEWEAVSCGPTTSMRMENMEHKLIKNFEIKMIIGKGGMGENTLKALKKYGAVYASFTGGAGVLAAESVKKILDVHWLDLGIPEALWVFKVENFGPLIITMDTHMKNMYSDPHYD
ncbi:MAG: FumA C-terminus/TtdB family hydratase beta subunit [Candidatus Odinarchaeia archaeon]